MELLSLQLEVDAVLLRARETVAELNRALLKIKALQPASFYQQGKEEQ